MMPILWRTTCHLPQRGQIGIFNRTYYEEVLIVRVHPEILISQGLPKELHNEKTIWEGRYRSIVNLEEHLYCNGTQIIKFFLHLSKKEQLKRFRDPATKAQRLNRYAMQLFDNLNYALAEKTLLRALAGVEKANLVDGPAGLATHGNLAVLAERLRNPEKAVFHSRRPLPSSLS